MKMKKIILCLSIACIAWLMGGQQVNVSAETQGNKDASVQLTEAQKKELEDLYNDLFVKKKEIINKYAEYGVITPEKAEKKLARLEKFKAELQENGYVAHWHHHEKMCEDHDKD